MTTADYERNMVLSNVDYKVVGTRPVRHDGADKVTGRAIYGADFDASGLLHGKILRSPHAHAKIVSIDTSKAEALEGVKAIATAMDFPQTSDKSVELGEDTTRLKWLRDNIAGVSIPDRIIERMDHYPEKEQAQIGLEISKEAIDDLKSIQGVAGVHIMAYRWEEAVKELVEDSGLSKTNRL